MWKWSALNSEAQVRKHQGLPGRKQDDCWLLQKYPPYPDYSLLTGSEITYWTDHSASSGGSTEVAEYISTCLFCFSDVLGLRFVFQLLARVLAVVSSRTQTDIGALCPPAAHESPHETAATRWKKHWKIFHPDTKPSCSDLLLRRNLPSDICFITSENSELQRWRDMFHLQSSEFNTESRVSTQ